MRKLCITIAFPALIFLNFSCSCPNKLAGENAVTSAEAAATKKHCSCEGGATVASFSGNDSYDGPVIGGQVGFSYELGNGPVTFKPGVNIAMQGAKYSDYVSGSVNLMYLNIPLLANYSTPGGFYGEAGIQPGFLLNAKDKYSGSSHNYKDHIQSFDFGVPFGLGYIFKNGFGIGARYVYGMKNINKPTSDGDNKNRVFSVRAIFTF